MYCLPVGREAAGTPNLVYGSLSIMWPQAVEPCYLQESEPDWSGMFSAVFLA